MKFPEFDFPIRKSPRADFHDYGEGCYFITICTAGKRHYFGEIHDGEMIMTEIGNYAFEQLCSIEKHYKYCRILQSVVMPNHIHAIVYISSHLRDDGSYGYKDSAPTPLKRSPLSVVVGGFKQLVTKYARRKNLPFGWQPRYHDHIIRGSVDGDNIARYIENNVANWGDDCFN
ncbi:MAG: transposase [Duncaniella sp.]|nr:transposase [Duncaniella sp.]